MKEINSHVSDSGDARKDLGHVLDFITRLKYLKVCIVFVIVLNKSKFNVCMYISVERSKKKYNSIQVPAR